MDNTKFFNEIKQSLFEHRITQVQVDSINATLASCLKHGVVMPEQIAYVLATEYHESRMKPIEEIGKGKGYKYGIHDPTTGQTYYGRGFVQLTWLGNYKAFSKFLGIDLVHSPELALTIPVAAEIIVYGMMKGMFTGKMLATYFNSAIKDPVSARRIVNGSDKAQLIAGYYNIFLHAIQS